MTSTESTATAPQRPEPDDRAAIDSVRADARWWREAIVYQVYVRSFADANGDGIGDLAGVRARLPYLHDLGVDALWFNPWYPSPLADNGYDISDYRSIDPAFGTLAEAEQLISEARALGIRTIVDIVPNHVSNQHPWFRAALASPPGSPERARFWFRPGTGLDGALPPNGWQSIFGGSAWTRTEDETGRPGEWYLHLFAPEQPDLNWTHPDVWAEHEDILRFWFERGVAGVRIDSAGLLVKDPHLSEEAAESAPGEHPYTDRDGVHEIYRRWRALADSYDEPRVLVGEIWLPDADRLARYLRPDELHTAFNFDFLACPWEPGPMRTSIESALATHAPVGAPATWVLSNHDVTRPVTRYGRADTSFAFESKRAGTPTDLERGTRRARAAALLAMALPGSMYVYQGEELGLPEVEDIPSERRQDPMWHRSGGIDPGRDGCRIPLPWIGDRPPYGFSDDGSDPPWLDQPDDWAQLSVAAQSDESTSMLSLYRAALRLRRTTPELGDGDLSWIHSADSVLTFTRGDHFTCLVNFGPDAVDLPPGATVLIASSELEGGALQHDSTVWLRQANPEAPSGDRSLHPDGTRAVESLELTIDEAEFMVFVGPSGCGKTTALRMVAGLEEISGGTILIGGRVVNEVSSKDRDVAMVFQNYALYPHMTVAQNFAFGLKLRRIDKAEIRRRVRAAATTLGLEDYLERKPSALSGGQRQRVAMGRAIVREPRAYLMDEPLSNLDAQLRVQMRAEIQKLQRALGVTTIYVTHDQTEAMTMGDRIAVMRDGTLQQVDTPERVYRRPENRFVAGFIGSPAMNMVSARLTGADGKPSVSFGDYSLAIDDEVIAERPALRAFDGAEVVVGIRPEDVEDAAFAADAPPGHALTTVCSLRETLGSEVLVHFPVATVDASSTFVARVHPQTAAREGERLRLVVDTRRLHFFDPASGLAIYD